MQALSFRRERPEDLGHPAAFEECARVQAFDVQFALVYLRQPLLRRRGYRLQAPFLVRDAVEQSVAVDSELLLPALLSFLPLRPCLRCSVEDALRNRLLVLRAFDDLLDAFAVDERSTCRDRQQKEAHTGKGRMDCQGKDNACAVQGVTVSSPEGHGRRSAGRSGSGRR